MLLFTVLSAIKICGRFFSAALEICSYSFCRAFDGTSFKKRIRMLSFSQAEIYAKQKSLQTFLLNSIRWQVSAVMELFHFKHGNNHRNKSIGICLYSFCRAFHGASFQEKNQGFLIYSSRDMLQTFETPREICFFFESSILLLCFQYYDINWTMMK